MLAALIQMNGRCHQPSDRRMLRDQARRTKEPSVPFVGRKSCTGSGIMLQSLLLRLPPLQERVANAVTFPTCQRADHNSDPVGNGDGGPESGATAPIFGAHGANRKGGPSPILGSARDALSAPGTGGVGSLGTPRGGHLMISPLCICRRSGRDGCHGRCRKAGKGSRR